MLAMAIPLIGGSADALARAGTAVPSARNHAAQKRHLIASSWICSAQIGHRFTEVREGANASTFQRIGGLCAFAGRPVSTRMTPLWSVKKCRSPVVPC